VGRCGGCLMQCAAYPLQLAAKQARAEAALSPLVGAVETIVPSPAVLGYRNKAKLVAAPRPGGGILLGSYAPRSHRVVDMAGCRVTEPPLDPVQHTLARLLSQAGVPHYDERTGRGALRYVILRANDQGRLLCVLVTRERAFAAGPALAAALKAAHPEVAGVVQNVNPARGGRLYGEQDHVLVGAGTLDDRIGQVRLSLGARAFFQINRRQAAALYQAVLDQADLRSGDTVIDLYAGVGGIALTLAAHTGRVVAVERDPVAAASARASAPANVSVVEADAAAGAGTLARVDLVVLDPPRKGCAPAVLSAAAALSPRRMIYVSCALDSLGRDLAALRELGYRAGRTRPFDLFPHTPHIETLTVLDRASA